MQHFKAQGFNDELPSHLPPQTLHPEVGFLIVHDNPILCNRLILYCKRSVFAEHGCIKGVRPWGAARFARTGCGVVHRSSCSLQTVYVDLDAIHAVQFFMEEVVYNIDHFCPRRLGLG